MAKTESTAVNQLIELVATQKPLPPDPTEDLMFSEPKSAPRVTANVPAVRGAGEVAPLPRSRAPSGTQAGNLTAPPPVRMSTMPPGRSTTIPPLGGSKAHGTPPPLPPNQTLTGAARPASAPATLPPLAPPSLNPRNTALGQMSNPGIAPPPVPASRPASNPSIAVPPQDLRSTTMGTGARAAVTSNPGSSPPAAPPPVQNLRSTALGTAANAAATVPPAPSEAPLTLPPEPPPGPPTNQTAMGVQPAENRTRPSLPPPVRPSAPLHLPVAAPFEPTKLPPGEQPVYGATPLDMTSHQAWFEQTELDMKTGLPNEHSVGTHQVPKRADWKPLAGKLIVPMLCLMMLGVFVGGYIAFDDKGKRGTHAAATAPATKVASKDKKPKQVAAVDEAKAEKAVADEKKVDEAKADKQDESARVDEAKDEKKVDEAKADKQADKNDEIELAAKTPEKPAKTEVAVEKSEPKARAEVAVEKSEPKARTEVAVAKSEPAAKTEAGKLVDVRINSAPQGATVMLVDRGKTLFLGTTPLQTSVDPSRKYELVFTYANKPTQVEAFDPASAKVLNVVIGKPGTQAVKAAEVPKKIEAPKASAPKAVEKKVEAPRAEAPKATEAPKVAAKVEKPAEAPKVAQMGVLMISSKPPCEIWIDGRPTGLTTPQREIKLSVGTHTITLVNGAENIKKTIAVSITADQPTKVIQNLMK